MSKPRYVDIDGKVYNADSCIPLNKAWESGDIKLHTLVRGSYPGQALGIRDLSGVKSVGFWDSNKAQTWGLDWHRNEGIEICYLESGSLDFEIGGELHHLKPRDLTITRPWLSHKLGNPSIGACKLHWMILDVGVRHPHQEWTWPSWIILNKEDLDILTTYLRQNESPVWKSSVEIASGFEQIGQLVDKKSNYDSKIKILINSIFMALLDVFKGGDVELNDKLVQTKRTVEIFLQDLQNHLIEDWTTESIAHHCNLGTTQITKYCREITNMSPKQYLSYLRLKKAAVELRLHMEKSISEVAYETGFSSPQYFATAFRQFFKMTPQQFRETPGRNLDEQF
ncbi:MAG: AraC family transcriptional regulator [Cyclobacteriaceae bacterium]|nr:AraC family transcriptional regulator [Cyclobacteriaceae bacterium]